MTRVVSVCMLVLLVGCDVQQPEATTGIMKAQANIETDPTTGLTTEQANIKARLEADNAIGSIKHLYVISAYSGQVIIYSTVKGKVTSSGKRLSPTSVAAADGQYVGERHAGINVTIGGTNHRTSEVLQDDGSYGSSVPYLYWWDVQGRYHQHYVSGGQIMHISDQPIATKDIILNLELSDG